MKKKDSLLDIIYKWQREVENRIAKLEKVMKDALIPSPLWKQQTEDKLSELKEQFEEHLHGEYVLREVLRELFEELPYTLFDNAESFIKKQLDKLGGGKTEERSVIEGITSTTLGESGSKPPSITIGIDVKPEGITGKILENPSEQDCANCGWKDENCCCKNVFDTVLAEGGDCWKPKEGAEAEIDTYLELGWKLIDEFLADLEWKNQLTRPMIRKKWERRLKE